MGKIVANTLKALDILRKYGILNEEGNPIVDEHGYSRFKDNLLMSEVCRNEKVPTSAIKGVIEEMNINFMHNKKDYVSIRTPSYSRIATVEKQLAELVVLLYQSDYKNFGNAMDTSYRNLRDWAFNTLRNQPKKVTEESNEEERSN